MKFGVAEKCMQLVGMVPQVHLLWLYLLWLYLLRLYLAYYGSLECEPDNQARASLVDDHGHGHGVHAAPWPLGA